MNDRLHFFFKARLTVLLGCAADLRYQNAVSSSFSFPAYRSYSLSLTFTAVLIYTCFAVLITVDSVSNSDAFRGPGWVRQVNTVRRVFVCSMKYFVIYLFQNISNRTGPKTPDHEFVAPSLHVWIPPGQWGPGEQSWFSTPICSAFSTRGLQHLRIEWNLLSKLRSGLYIFKTF